eukprot:s7350_g2.t1
MAWQLRFCQCQALEQGCTTTCVGFWALACRFLMLLRGNKPESRFKASERSRFKRLRIRSRHGHLGLQFR